MRILFLAPQPFFEVRGTPLAVLAMVQALTGLGVTEGVRSFHVNFIYSPLPKVDVGAELIWGERALESGAEGELRRLHTHVKYSF